jgi:bifunctional non-homologous end joining protein LigD
MALDTYHEKRTPDRTPEPFGAPPKVSSQTDGGMYVIQKHAARRLHYDFRLEMEGVLRSWAVPKGPSLDPAQKHLAVMVEDHPLDYGGFEGVIPAGNYGAGAVIVWDRGVYRALSPPGDVARSIRDGKVDIELHGFKLHGAFTMVRTHGIAGRGSANKENWLLIKKRDEWANTQDLLATRPRSVLSGLTIEEMAASAELEAEVVHEVEQLKPPRLSLPPSPKSFPLSLARLHREPFDSAAWLFEIKYDGVRALAIRDGGEARLYGRSGSEITRRYPEITLALNRLPFERFVMDGEIVILDAHGRASFQMLQRRITITGDAEINRLAIAQPAACFMFDLLAAAGRDLRGAPLERRKAILARMVKGDAILRYCDHVVERGRDFYALAADAEVEGIVAKRRESKYAGRRTGDWLKIKCPRSGRFVIGGWTDPARSRTGFGALLLGQYEDDGSLRFVGRAGTGFDNELLSPLGRRLESMAVEQSPFRRSGAGEPRIPRNAHFCRPELVCEVRYSEWTGGGVLRHPAFLRVVDDADPGQCRLQYSGAEAGQSADPPRAEPKPWASARQAAPARQVRQTFQITHPQKIFWPAEGYTKADLVDYYLTIAPWMLPYLKDRPVVLTRYPDGIEGKSFFQKDAPAFAPAWIRREKIYSRDTHRWISYFILESAEAIAYMANLGVIPIHIWSSRVPHLEHPDWLLFDIDSKESTTAKAIRVAREVRAVLDEIGLRPCVKTSGQMGIHVLVGLESDYTYEHARQFAELVARAVVKRIPEHATLARPGSRQGRAYIDYLQLGHGKTIAAPFAVRPWPGAPVSAPLEWDELTAKLEPRKFNIKTIPKRMERIGRDPFRDTLQDRQHLEPSLKRLEKMLP